MESITPVPVNIPHVDTHLGKFSQGCTVLLTALAFLFNQPILVLITAIILAWSALVPAASLYRLLYQYIVVPLGLLKPRIAEDDPAPHRFAQSIGAIFLFIASIVLFFTQATVLGWIFDLIVFVLSGINLAIGFCAGCFVYYHLGRLGMLPKVRYEGGFRWRGV
ncbi:MAG TPA: DUF4395 domain-containing protein [Ktedonobacteraceae bacterium]|jgi:hypothetical protein|nr:DUF4395 domain-containing protein [Ktedonobacteraceae bacterium]